MKDNNGRGDVYPGDRHVTRFRICDAQITAIPIDGATTVEHGLSLIVEEGRYYSLHDRPDGEPPLSTLEYMCFVTIDGAAAPDAWSGVDARIVITGTHEAGMPITITGLGAIGKDDNGFTEVSFESVPEMLVVDTG